MEVVVKMETLWGNELVPALVLYNLRILVRGD
jgi:hypothetical protein